ncbi:MAG: hypothetical protein EOM03_16675 [Clostridia bacterium]|nr:hypothetical protein [Clostridia bacterium]
MKFQRWRPIRTADNLGPKTRGMRHDQMQGEYYLAADVDAEISYLLAQLRVMGWQECREEYPI